MSDSYNLNKTFNHASLKDYTTNKSRQRAGATFSQYKRATSTAIAAFKKVADANKSNPGQDFTIAGMSKGGEQKRARVLQAHTKLKVRLDKIERAKDNRIERIKKAQELETRVQQKMGRSLSQEFRRGR
jgi:hypothetical protein